MFDQELHDIVYHTAGRAEVRAAIHEIYDDLQAKIDVRRPLCQTSGRCCRFDEFGHRLYVTTAELATFIYQLEIEYADRPKANVPPSGCEFQQMGLCSVHRIRPFGCRIFFCDASSTEWQQTCYEEFHARLKQLHEALEVPYRYMEWRAALAAVRV